ncbi:hypothetical protein [Shewanella oncorhynchi]|uniref:hypothetical protein n=1 Tax=Shewanella oncorhynchi TaxID=2726434 RepID=UPI003D7B5E3C
MSISIDFNRALFNLNVSSRELNKLERIDVKKISAIDINRLGKTISKTQSKAKQDTIIKILNKVGQFNEDGIHILSKYSKDEVINVKQHMQDGKITDDNQVFMMKNVENTPVNNVFDIRSKEMIDDFIFGFSQKKAKPDIYALLNKVKFEKHVKPMFNALPCNERDAINFYIGNRNGENLQNPERFNGIFFSDLNSYLRGYEVSEDMRERVNSIATDMYSGLMKLPIGESSTISYRAIDAKGVAGFEALNEGVGFFDFAPMSSSENQDFVRGWFKTRMANYPVENPAVFILEGNPINTGVLTNKSEVIYPSGTKFEIIHSDVRDVKLMEGYERSMKFFVVRQLDHNNGIFIDLASGRKESSDTIAMKLTDLGLVR